MSQSIVGKVIDNYQITEVLGEGGMGVVYKARNLKLDKDVALKMMDPNLARDETFLRRFKAEATSLAKLQNPNIVTVYDFRETEEGICIIMEFVEGGTLAQRIRESGPLPLELTLLIFKQILTALDHAHKAGVIHRDIKPGNIMLTSDNVAKVTDFGLAKIQKEPSATVTQAAGGTLYYMPPEQMAGLGNVDHRGDIYSLGMTLYETLTGSLPFKKTDAQFTIEQTIVEGKIPSPDRIKPDLPKDLVRIVMKAIEKDPDKRYQSAREMLEAMEKSERGAPPPKSTVPPRRSPMAKSLIIASAVVVVGVGIFFAFPLFRAQPRSTLSITTIPSGSVVSIDGTVVGTSRIQDYAVKPGSHAVHVSNPGYDAKDTNITLGEGQDLVLSVPLAKISQPAEVDVRRTPDLPKVPPSQTNRIEENRVLGRESESKATLILRAVPRGSVSVDGRSVSNDDETTTSVTVDAGERIVEFRHPTYDSKWRQPVKVRPGQTLSITCYFEWSVNIVAKPVWATIIVDGKNTGMVTPRAFVLGPGRHAVTVSRAGFETVEGSEEIVVVPTTEQRVVPISFTLRKKGS